LFMKRKWQLIPFKKNIFTLSRLLPTNRCIHFK
jgi:hypothetical protein